MKSISRAATAIALTTAMASTASFGQTASKPSFTGFGVGANLSFVKNSMKEPALALVMHMP